ncbi:hypothetical protein ACOMHN_028716 [Nucella lapillus]
MCPWPGVPIVGCAHGRVFLLWGVPMARCSYCGVCPWLGVPIVRLNPDPRERHSLWGCVIGGCVMWLVNCFNQASVQRIGSLKTLRSAKLAFLLNTPLNVMYGLTLTLTGLLLYSYVVTIGCDPYQAGLIHNKNQMMPYFVIHVLDDLPGFAGLYMSMLFSGALRYGAEECFAKPHWPLLDGAVIWWLVSNGRVLNCRCNTVIWWLGV